MDRNRLLLAMALASTHTGLSPHLAIDGWDMPNVLENNVGSSPSGKNYFNRSASKYKPHQGVQAIARRAKQIESGFIKVN